MMILGTLLMLGRNRWHCGCSRCQWKTENNSQMWETRIQGAILEADINPARLGVNSALLGSKRARSRSRRLTRLGLKGRNREHDWSKYWNKTRCFRQNWSRYRYLIRQIMNNWSRSRKLARQFRQN